MTGIYSLSVLYYKDKFVWTGKRKLKQEREVL